MSDKQEQLLARIVDLLEAPSKQHSREGFFDYSRRVFCNVTKGNGDGWYTLQGDVATTLQPLFRGRVVSICFPTVERRGQAVRKFHLVMAAKGEAVTFESGYNCFFSKTVLSAFAMTTADVLAQPIQLATFIKALSTGDQTLAVSMRAADGHKLSCDWRNDDDWKAISTVAMANVEAAVNSR